MTDLPPATVGELVAQAARRHATRPAIVATNGDVVCTYEQLRDLTEHVSSALRRLGVGPGDEVLVMVPTAAEMLIAVLGSMNVGACVPMNPSYSAAELDRIIDVLQPAAAVVLDAMGGPIQQIIARRSLPVVRIAPGGSTMRGEIDHEPHLGELEHVPPLPDGVALVLHTAGTTAQPKQVPLTHSNVVTAARNVVASLQLVAGDRCLNVMPLFHSHGLLGAAMSTLAAGASIVCANRMERRRFLGWANDTKATWYTASPTIHQLVLGAPGEWPTLRLMRSASAPLAPQIAQALEERFGAPMIEVFGMTEAYQISANPLPPAERRLGTVGKATGTEIAIADAAGSHLPPGVEGEVVVRGPAVFARYAAPQGANLQAFFGDWFRTGDLGSLSADGYLTLTGRQNEQINRGGEKVGPREIDEALLAHPDVVAAMAFPIADPVLGEEIGVAIVARKGATLDARSVRVFLHGRVAPFKVPRRVLIVDELPTTSTGKLQRVGFAESHHDELGGLSGPHTTTVGDPTSKLDQLSAIWRELLECGQPPAPTDHFFDLGGTSLLVMELVERIEKVFGVDLPVVDVLEVPTLEAMAEQIDSTHAPAHHLGLHRCRNGTSGTHLILVPGQMGMAVGLQGIADAVTVDVDIWMFEYPGHRPGESPAMSIEDLAGALLSAMYAAGISGPVALYGNSLGSWVVFEAARLLEAQGRTPILVGIGDLYSPFVNTRRSTYRPPFHHLVRNRYRRLKRRWTESAGHGKAASVSAAELRRRSVVAASSAALKKYQPHPYGGDLLVFSADERNPKFGFTLGWEHHVSGNIRPVRLNGSHSTMHTANALDIASALSNALALTGDD